MTHKWTRTPSGKFIRHRPDPLKLYLSQRTQFMPLEMTDITEDLDHSEPTSQGNSTSYNTEIFDSRKLPGSQVTILGNGSVGSHLAQNLGPAQLRLNIIDVKNVEPKHTEGGRTAFDPSQIGVRKVEASRDKIESSFPGTKVTPYPYKTSDIPDTELLQMFAVSFAVVLAIDDPSEILRIARLAYPVTELVQVAMHAGAMSGHIALSIPFVTPCLACTLNVSRPNDIHRRNSEPANSWDIITVAQLAARLVIDIIYSKVSGQPITRWDTSKNLIYIANTRQELSPDGPGLYFESSQKRPDCSICNNTP